MIFTLQLSGIVVIPYRIIQKYKQANWVAYLLTRTSTSLRTRFQRGEFFAPDPLIPGTDFSVDFQKSRYDRGHLAPATDLGFIYFNYRPNILLISSLV